MQSKLNSASYLGHLLSSCSGHRLWILCVTALLRRLIFCCKNTISDELYKQTLSQVYSTSFGRRKSWLVPVQLVTAVLMIGLANSVDEIMGMTGTSQTTTTATTLSSDEEQQATDASTMDVGTLTLYFFALYFLMATQVNFVFISIVPLCDHSHFYHESTNSRKEKKRKE
jgi:hypothetical protein